MQDRQFYSPSDIATEMGISSATVLRLIHSGEMPAIRVSSRIYRVPAASFEKFKAGTLERPFVAQVRQSVARPRIGAGERLPEASAAGVPTRVRVRA